MMSGSPILYRQRGGKEVATTGVWEPKAIVRVAANAYGRTQQRGGLLSITRENVVDLGREPKEGDEVDVNGETFVVVEIEAEGVNRFLLTLTYVRQIEVSGGGLRRREGSI